jgi:TM2 domain-containing membrane protein YozV
MSESIARGLALLARRSPGEFSVAAEWYYAKGQQQIGPVSEADLKSLASDGTLAAGDLVWKTGMTDWVPARQVPGLFPAASEPPPLTVPDDVSSTKLAAGLCGILVGMFGVHKFVLNMNTPGIIMLVVSVATCGIGGTVMWVIGIVEGVKYLVQSDEEFYETYMVGKKEWF